MGLVCGMALVCAAQQTSPSPPTAPSGHVVPPPAGIENSWDVHTVVDALLKDCEDLKAVLFQLNPQQWYEAKGASSTYILQRNSAQQQVNDVLVTARMFAAKTDSIALAVDVYFRIDALEVTAHSLSEGASRYADRPTSERLNQVIARNFNNREHFRDYVRDLSNTVEQNFKIADDEAQRCRGMISREPAPKSVKKKKTNGS